VGTVRHADRFQPGDDLAAQNPAKLKELRDQFLKEAVKYNVLPIDDRVIERVNAKLAGRPDLMPGGSPGRSAAGRTSRPRTTPGGVQ
jgi:hypothetical protein